jgi:hypothetical protein
MAGDISGGEKKAEKERRSIIGGIAILEETERKLEKEISIGLLLVHNLSMVHKGIREVIRMAKEEREGMKDGKGEV